RPTAVNLFWALGRMRRRIEAARAAAGGTPDPGALFVALLAEAEMILELTRTFLNVKVIAMSGHSTEKLQKARLLGARHTFTKPFNVPELLRAIEYELQH
ncbi:MAG TPA: hypothetical protein PLO50_09725, partial [Nitrospira sp.]|nr:hypothetical protein [Nitrospira sp.]